MAATELKIISDNGGSLRIGGYGLIFGGRDVVGDYFTPNTDFWFSKVTENPMVLFQHGQDPMLKRTVVGRVVSKQPDDLGLWIEAQITASKQYADAIRELVHKGVLGWSSGSVPHLVQRVKGTLPGTNEITSWPIVELSLTPTPAEPRTIGVKELKSLAQLDPLLTIVAEEAEAKELPQETKPWRIVMRGGQHCVIGGASGDTQFGCHDTREGAMMQMRALYANEGKAQQGLARSDYAWVDSSGTGHLDISDEGHVRAAMARFNQTHFDSPSDKRSAARKILARARSMGIEISPDSAVVNAAKGATMPDLPDTAFAYVEPGGIKDGGITSPRANRHFVHHDEDGNVDRDLLALAILEAKASPHAPEALAHLLSHEAASDDVDETHTKYWAADGVAAELLVSIDELKHLLPTVISDQKAMERVGWANVEHRVQPEPLQRLNETIQRLTVVSAHARQADSGDDGTARAEYLRRRLALLDV